MMKALIALSLVACLSVHADTLEKAPEVPIVAAPAAKAPEGPRYSHIMSDDGSVLATIDSKNGSIEHKTSAKVTADRLMRLYESLLANCNKAVSDLQAQVVEAKKPKKK